MQQRWEFSSAREKLQGARTTGANVSTRSSPNNVSVFATGLNNPRGLKFGPDGNLYVAEGGVGGTNSTEGCCEQVIPPVGPYTGSATGSRISKIDANGNRTTAVDNLPSSQTSAATGNLTSGAADVAFIGNTLYIVMGVLAAHMVYRRSRSCQTGCSALMKTAAPNLLPT